MLSRETPWTSPHICYSPLVLWKSEIIGNSLTRGSANARSVIFEDGGHQFKPRTNLWELTTEPLTPTATDWVSLLYQLGSISFCCVWQFPLLLSLFHLLEEDTLNAEADGDIPNLMKFFFPLASHSNITVAPMRWIYRQIMTLGTMFTSCSHRIPTHRRAKSISCSTLAASSLWGSSRGLFRFRFGCGSAKSPVWSVHECSHLRSVLCCLNW